MSKERKKFKDTAVGQFLQKNAADIVDKVGDVFPPANILKLLVKDKLTPDQQVEFDKHMQDYEKEMYALEIDDRKNARDMYKSDNHLQKVFAITFLIAYVVVLIGILIMIYTIAVMEIKVPDWAIGTISALFGGMSTKVGTITDFLFGSSYRPDHPPTITLK
jgi:hypothetical protein